MKASVPNNCLNHSPPTFHHFNLVVAPTAVKVSLFLAECFFPEKKEESVGTCSPARRRGDVARFTWRMFHEISKPPDDPLTTNAYSSPSSIHFNRRQIFKTGRGPLSLQDRKCKFCACLIHSFRIKHAPYLAPFKTHSYTRACYPPANLSLANESWMRFLEMGPGAYKSERGERGWDLHRVRYPRDQETMQFNTLAIVATVLMTVTTSVSAWPFSKIESSTIEVSNEARKTHYILEASSVQYSAI
ncbi:uncharacterized protein ARMOST_00343 [Armillaria ostoyae]|uniref:Uncharacterized protein n=1 Tax=Armillaria ostoyae TaxID=47428 RepID=A0A284QKY5_ARMOS|nr:uncharacterized protein ARMOST_00343 [Armillaria ostoyae]